MAKKAAKKSATKSAAKKKKKAPSKKAKKKYPRSGRLEKVPGTRLTKVQKAFLDALERLDGKISVAAAEVGVDRMAHYKVWMPKPAYNEAFHKSLAIGEELAKDRVRKETDRRALDGWDEVILERKLADTGKVDAAGKPIMVTIEVKEKRSHKFSDMLLALRNNQLFGDVRRMELTGKNGQPIEGKVSLDVLREIVGQGNGVKNGKKAKK